MRPTTPQDRLPLLQLNMYLNGEGSLTCQHCQPTLQPVTIQGSGPLTSGTLNGGTLNSGTLTSGHNGNGKQAGEENAAGGTNPSPTPASWLALPTLRQAVREALPLGLGVVRLCGGLTRAGDALLYPEFDALLDLLEQLELRTELETAGEGLTPKLAVRLGRQPRCGATIGLNGADAATHDGLRGQPGSFDTASSAVEMLAEQGVAVEIVFAVHRRNAGQIQAMVRLAERLGAQALRFVIACPIAARMPATAAVFNSAAQLVMPNHKGSHSNGNHSSGTHSSAARGDLLAQHSNALAVEELIAIGRKVDRELSHGTRVRLLFDQPPAFRGLHPVSRVEDMGHCGILNTLGMLPDGSYALCGVAQPHASAAPELVLGRAGVDALEQIWRRHPTLAMLRDGLPDRLRGVCERCTIKAACMGYCPTENYLRAGSFWSPYWFCEAANGVSLFPASRLAEV